MARWESWTGVGVGAEAAFMTNSALPDSSLGPRGLTGGAGKGGEARARWWLDWRLVVLGLLVLLLVWQVVVPLVMIVWASFKTVHPGEPAFLDMVFTASNYIRALGTENFAEVTLNTLYFSGASTLIAFVLGTFLAWIVDRTNTPLRGLIGIVTLARIIIPGILITVSWVFMASPNIGILNHLMEGLTGIEKAFNIYTFWGMVWVHSLEMVPLAYLLLSAAFQSMDPRLEEASMMTGAGTIRTFRRISLPLIMPAVAAVGLLLFITTVDTFDVPLLLGGRADVPVYATEVFFNISRTPTDWGLASAYSMSLLILSVVLLAVYFWLLRHSERYQTVTGKDFRPRRIDLGRWKYMTCAASLLITFLITGVPFVMMFYSSFLTYFETPSLKAFEAMDLTNYRALLGEDGFIIEPLVNSTLLGIGTATTVMLVVAVIAYYVHKTRVPGRKALDFLAFSAIAFPSVVLGTAFMWLYLIVPAPILGTLTIIGLAYLTKYMPIALRFVSNSMLQIHDELEEAAVVAGVPWWKNFFCIYLPLLRPGLMAGWFWVMVHAFRELTIALVLAQSENRTAAVLIYDLWEEGSFQQLSAFGVLMFLILIVLVAIAHAIGKRYGVKEQM